MSKFTTNQTPFSKLEGLAV